MSLLDSVHCHVQQLNFGDGSRILDERPYRQHDGTDSISQLLRDPSISIDDFYEIHRIVREISELISKKTKDRIDGMDSYSIRVALQFPDELLVDSPEVCWQFESFLPNSLIFCLGDSTYAPCCPDIAGGAHLNADCIVHYGNACFQQCNRIPVIYSVGGYSSRKDDKVVESLASVFASTRNQLNNASHSTDNVLLLYEAQYYHMIDDLRQQMSARSETAVVAAVLNQHKRATTSYELTNYSTTNTHLSDDFFPESNKNDSVLQTTYEVPVDSFTFSGLMIPRDFDLADCTLIFIGDNKSQLFLHIAMRLLSSHNKIPKLCYTWNPAVLLHKKYQECQPARPLDLSSIFQRKLNRRFYLIQRAKECSVFGILVSNTSDLCVRTVVQSIRHIVEYERCDSDSLNCTGRSTYTFVVGKVNVAKLSNFAEIDCFVLVACPEQSLLQDEKEYAVPIITPLELCFALGFAEWGNVDYSLEGQDFMDIYLKQRSTCKSTENVCSEPDAPYFSLISGHVQSTDSKSCTEQSRRDQKELDLPCTSDKTHLATYNSAASDHLKAREYQGLLKTQQKVEGNSRIQVAALGQKGIASNYSSR